MWVHTDYLKNIMERAISGKALESVDEVSGLAESMFELK